MLTSIARSLVVLATLAPLSVGTGDRPAVTTTGPDSQLDLQPGSRIWVDGSSTVRGFTCDATAITAVVRTRGPVQGTEIVDLQSLVDEVAVTIPVAALECGNGTMNDHMRKALKAGDHPEIAFRLTSYGVARQEDGTDRIAMLGTLTIAGSEREISIDAEAAAGPDGTLVVKGTKEIDMTEFEVKPPRLMLGTLKVHDRVAVHFDLALKPAVE